MNNILQNGKMRVENRSRQKLESEKTRVYAQKPRFKNSISGHIGSAIFSHYSAAENLSTTCSLTME